MDKKSVKKIITRLFFKLCYWQLKIEMILFGYTQKSRILCEEVELPIDGEIIQLEADIVPVYGNRKGIVTIVSDDGFYVSGVHLNELVKKYNLRATIAGAVSFVKPYLQEWKKILSEGYLEMVSHSYRHKALREGDEISLEKDRIYFEIVRSARWLEKNFYNNEKQVSFVCPEGAICENANKILQENGFYSVRRAGQGYNTLDPREGKERGEWFSLNVKGICEKDVDEDERRQWIDEVANSHLWLIEMWHNVMESDDGFYQTILKEEAEEHLRYISDVKKEGRIWVATLTEATKYIRERQNAKVMSWCMQNNVYLKVTIDTNILPEMIFNYPLTVKVKVPETMVGRVYYYRKNKLEVLKDCILLADIVPNGLVHKIEFENE